MGTVMTSNEVPFSSGSKEADLRIFFMCFLQGTWQLTSTWTTIWGSRLQTLRVLVA